MGDHQATRVVSILSHGLMTFMIWAAPILGNFHLVNVRMIGNKCSKHVKC